MNFRFIASSGGRCSPARSNIRTDLERILLQLPLLETLCISGVLELRLVLLQMVQTFLPNVCSLHLYGDGETASELQRFLVHRPQQGKQSLGLLRLDGCGIRSQETVNHMQEFAEEVVWDGDSRTRWFGGSVAMFKFSISLQISCSSLCLLYSRGYQTYCETCQKIVYVRTTLSIK